MSVVTKSQFTSITGKSNADKYYDAMIAMCDKYQINTKERFAFLLANVLEETGNFTVGAENMNYTSLARIQKVFAGSRSPLLTQKLVGNPQLLANTVYGGEWGKRNLGNTKPNDGWYFRGRGAMQTTGRAAYEELSMHVFGDQRLLENPDLILEPNTSLECAAFEFKKKGCNQLADVNNFRLCVRRINGGLTNIENRERWLAKIRKVI